MLLTIINKHFYNDFMLTLILNGFSTNYDQSTPELIHFSLILAKVNRTTNTNVFQCI